MARSRFFVDFATFAADDGNRLEVYYKIFNDGLKYVKKNDKYVSNYEINVIILGEKDRQVTGQSVDKAYVLDDYGLTRSREGYLINQIDLDLQPGDYGLICKLIDHNSNDVSTIEAQFTAPEFDRGGDISAIEFLQDTDTLQENSRFFKNGLTAVPAVERVYDNERESLGFFAEVYLARYLGENLILEYEIAGERGGSSSNGIIQLNSDSEVGAVRRFEPLDELTPGDYELTLALKRGGIPIAERSADFTIKWSLASLIRNDFDYAIEQLRYLISKEEKEELYAAPESLRLEKFEEWWNSKDPSPGTPENELREEYYRRIRYANQYYRAINREGWQTDRGMIYIKHGEPDQIDRHPFELGRKPYQIWYYYGKRLTFLFVDTHGDGDYQLQYPYDGDWRRYNGP
jgi:GWxTD domain-containing protein